MKAVTLLTRREFRHTLASMKLASDQAAGDTEKWELHPKLPRVRYNSGTIPVRASATDGETPALRHLITHEN